MEVILLSDVAQVGQRGSTVRVKDGYARNFLLPQHLAVVATTANRAHAETDARRRAANTTQARAAAQQMQERLVNESVAVAVKTGPEGHLFGSVTADDIVRALGTAGFAVTKKQVRLEAPIKALGVYDVPLRVHPEIPMTARVRVVKA